MLRSLRRTLWQQEKPKMATFIVLISFTGEGVRDVKDTLKQAETFKEAAGKYGVSVRDIHWTLGQFDMVATMEGPDDWSVTALTLAVSAAGNIRTQTLRAFDTGEMKLILDKVASARAAF